MDRAQIEAMIAEQVAKLEKLKDGAIAIQGAVAILREQLRRIDAAEAAVAEEAAKKRALVLRNGETCLSGRYPRMPMPDEPALADVWVTQESDGTRVYEWRGDSDLVAVAGELESLVPELPWELVEVERDFSCNRTIYRREPQEAPDGE